MPPPPDFIIQAALLLLAVIFLFVLQTVPKRVFANLRRRGRSTLQAKRHFVAGAQLLARARSSPNPTTSFSLAKSASAEADLALSFDPKDAAAHILKSLALHLMGHKSSALRSLDTALSPPSSKSLSDAERADALVKRAELQIEVNRRRRTDAAVSDLVEAIGLTSGNLKAYCLLGSCYEHKGMKEEAREAYESAVRIDETSTLACDGLKRLASD
ncbi:uncharacterized protein LOC131218693 [Magnolia sinica]|uniref:uncharacterized protein LOC131218693 n=1 Tax=Magnolia sinica TaxID=86752 RepID=UPI002659C085|nr:uncharacterized protein LOC131218693 [Magnolia sinica]XP_058069376.1 uncharacterized protein LOC131218693 [Magnolia sinica]XP_058069377.1 uncharacterized protein LOC131218693 [Magnolia sinica]XP_058069378.1 uncharacterized protein LOC131218693 [Magnolia sinica]